MRCQHKRQTEIVKAGFQREVKKTRPDKLYLPLAIADRISEPFLIRGDYYSRILAGTRIPMTLKRIGKKDTDNLSSTKKFLTCKTGILQEVRLGWDGIPTIHLNALAVFHCGFKII